MQIKGTFEVEMKPEPPYSDIDGVAMGRVAIAKKFHGALEATSEVAMLAARNAAQPTSAGYVAIERVIGTLEGRAGTFVLQHNGIMNRGAGSLDVTVVPDSGTGALIGLSGKMKIDIIDKQHHYTLDFELAQ